MQIQNPCAESAAAYAEYAESFRAFKNGNFDFSDKEARKSALTIKEKILAAESVLQEWLGKKAWERWMAEHEAYNCRMPDNPIKRRSYWESGEIDFGLDDTKEITGMKLLDRNRLAVCYDDTLFIYGYDHNGIFQKIANVKTEMNYGYEMQLLPGGRLACLDVGEGNILIFSGLDKNKPVFAQKIEGNFGDLQAVPGNRLFASSLDGPVIYKLADNGRFGIEHSIDDPEYYRMLMLSDASIVVIGKSFHLYKKIDGEYSLTAQALPGLTDLKQVFECDGKLYLKHTKSNITQLSIIAEKNEDGNFVFPPFYQLTATSPIGQFLSKDYMVGDLDGRLSLFTVQGQFLRAEVAVKKNAPDIEMSPSGRIFMADGNKIKIFDGSKYDR